nr:hypothetical protein [Phenylobacterium sp. J367]
MAEALAQRAERQQRHHHPRLVGGDDQHGGGRRGAQSGAKGGQRDVGDAGVQHHQRHGRQNGDDRHPPPDGVERRVGAPVPGVRQAGHRLAGAQSPSCSA